MAFTARMYVELQSDDKNESGLHNDECIDSLMTIHESLSYSDSLSICVFSL